MFYKKSKYNKYEKELELIKQKKTYRIDSIVFEIIDVIEKEHNITLRDNQIIAALALIDGHVIDMGTGEGKTYSGLLAACYLAKKKRFIHIFTANEYLAYRDFQANKNIFQTLNINAAVLLDNSDFQTKYLVHQSNIVYTPVRRMILDYLSNNQVLHPSQFLEINLDFAIIDEADFVMLDQGTSPVITSDTKETEYAIFKFMQDNKDYFEKDTDFTVNEENKSITLNESSYLKMESLFINNNLIKTTQQMYQNNFFYYVNYLENMIRANYLVKKDIDYFVNEDFQIVLIDPVSGRSLGTKQRYSMGFHQAIEAKENVEIKPEERISNSISIQNFFRKYNNISAMSGTAKFDSEEFFSIFNLELFEIPSAFNNKKIIHEDKFFIELENKNKQLIKILQKNIENKRPIMIATTSVQESEDVSALLNEHNIKHNLLNAKNPKEESRIISKAGEINQITVTTNIAGRGADIKLGGEIESLAIEHPELSEAELITKQKENHDFIDSLGGLLILGYSRSESRRIDQQLSGRCGRQNDNGEVQFLLSLDDSIAEHLPKKQIGELFGLLGIDGEEGAFHPTISSNFLRIQKRIEKHELETRKEIIKFDDVIEKHRNIYFDFRKNILFKEDMKEWCFKLIDGWTSHYLDDFNNINPMLEEEKKVISIENNILRLFQVKLPLSENNIKYNDTAAIINKALKSKLEFLENNFNDNYYGYLKASLLHNLNNLWSDYSQSLQSLQKQVNVRNIGQKNPYEEFSEEAYILFSKFIKELPFQMIFIMLQNHNQMQTPKVKQEQENND